MKRRPTSSENVGEMFHVEVVSFEEEYDVLAQNLARVCDALVNMTCMTTFKDLLE